MKNTEHLFMALANSIEEQLRNNVLKVGDKLPSLRTIAMEKKVSLNTALNAYFELERRGLVEARTKSGYYVTRAHKSFRETPALSDPKQLSAKNELSDLFSALYFNNGLKGINLASSQLSPELLPVPQLNKEIVKAIKHLPYGGLQYERFGNDKLKKQIAIRSLRWGGNLKADDIIPTPGCFDAIMLCMTTLLKRGDTIAVESPVHFGVLNLAKTLGLKVLELPTHPVTGIELGAVQKQLAANKIDMLLVMGNFSNPFGSYMPEKNKKDLVALLERYEVPMIEDDIYSDFHFGDKYPTFCKTYDKGGLVMWCGSVSKKLAGGYRVGWLEPGKFKDAILKAKPYHPVNCSTVTHEAIANFFANNRYDNYLKKLRQELYVNSLHFLRCIHEYFPRDVKVTRPQGGIQVWLEFNKRTNAMELYNTAIANKIIISPGRTYTLQDQYTNCIRLSYGMPWNSRVEHALKVLGKLARV